MCSTSQSSTRESSLGAPCVALGVAHDRSDDSARELVNHVFHRSVKACRVEICRSGFITNAPCLASCLSPLSDRFSGARVPSPKTEACWTAIARGLLAQRELTRSALLEDENASLGNGRWRVERSSIGVSACNQANAHKSGTCVCFRLPMHRKQSWTHWLVSHVTK